MKKAIEQHTLQALVETGAARARAGVALTDHCRTVFRRRGHQGARQWSGD